MLGESGKVWMQMNPKLTFLTVHIMQMLGFKQGLHIQYILTQTIKYNGLALIKDSWKIVNSCIIFFLIDRFMNHKPETWLLPLGSSFAFDTT